MKKTVQNIPFLRLSLAFAVGVVIGKYANLSHLVLFAGLIILFIGLCLIHRKYAYKFDPIFGACSFLFFLFLGSLTFVLFNKTPSLSKNKIFVGTILEVPQEKQNTYKTQIEFTSIITDSTIVTTNEKVIAYLTKTEAAKHLRPGTQIITKAVPQEIENFGNPFEFDYKAYLKNKRIYRQIYIDKNNWHITEQTRNSLTTSSELLREKLLNIYRSQNLGKNETEILSALTLGYKRNLERETKRIFSAAGAMHVLAVSGLHVGIIFMVYNFLFGFLRRQKKGRLAFVTGAISLLWFYAFITGFSPSVLRASAMFSIVIIGTNLNRRANIYNSLAASAFFLLVINPNNLFEVGFQLSYSAVFGIVFLQPKLEKLWQAPNKIASFFWSLFTVSLAAQLATFPLTTFYFNQFPVYFWLSNMIVIPAVTLLVPLGIALLLFAKIPLLGTFIASLTQGLIKGIYLILRLIKSLPSSTINLSFDMPELLFLLTTMGLTLLFIQNRRVFYLKSALTAVVFLFLMTLSKEFVQHNNNSLIVYNNSSNLTIHLISGRKNYLISQHPIEQQNFLYQQIQNVKNKNRLRPPVMIGYDQSFEDSFLLKHNNLLFFKGKTIWVDPGNKNMFPDLTPDFVIAGKNFRKKTTSLDKKTHYILPLHYTNSEEHSNLHSLKAGGAFIKSWKEYINP